MNFITKNLGWILLLCFFVFMLFVIASNNNETSELGGTGSQTSQDENPEQLDELINMLDEEEDSKNAAENDQAEDKEEQGEEKDSKGFFSFLGRDTASDDSGENETNTQDTQEEDSEKTLSEEKDTEEKNETNEERENNNDNDENEDAASGGIFSKIFGGSDKNENTNKQPEEEDSFIVRSTENQSEEKETQNLVKDTGESQANVDYSYAPELQNSQMQNLPGVDLQTQVGKTYQLGVNALKLNNKYFTQTLGYLEKGDRVTQLSPENSYGCFEVEVEKNKTRGYVCKKWFTEIQSAEVGEDTYSDNQETQETQEVVPTNPTSIGDQIIISDAFIVIDGTPLERGDIVDQLTQTDTQGCFKALVTKTFIIPARGEVPTVCHRDIK